MKRIAYTLSLVAATAMAAAPLAAQSGNGPWWDPGRTQTRSGQNGSVYGRNGSVYSQQADGVWRADSRDRNGNTIYVRTRYDSNGNLVREWATRNIIGRYNIIDRQYLNDNSGQYGSRGTYDTRGTYGNQGVYNSRANEEQIERQRREQDRLQQDQIRRDQRYQRDQYKLQQEQIKRNEQYQREQIKEQEKIAREQNKVYNRDNGKHKGRGHDKDNDGDRH